METAVEPQAGGHLSHLDRDWSLLDLRRRVCLLPGQEFDRSDAARSFGPPDSIHDLPAFEQRDDYVGGAGFQPRPRGSLQDFWLATIVLAAIFLASTAAEWRRLIYQKGLTISTNLFGTTFYSLVGLHASHVIVGMCLLLLVFIFSLRGFVTIMHRERLQMISWYWHFVDAVWIVVFTVVYVIGR